jgi:hypothetical protein
MFLVMATLALPAISVKAFAATVIATLECFPPKLIIDHDGTGALNNLVTVTLKNVAYRTDLLTGLISLPPKPCSMVCLAVVLSVLA